jgi:hypothetical protein
MSGKESKRTASEQRETLNESAVDEKEPTLAEGFQVNILDLVNLYISLIEKITQQGVESPCKKSFLQIAHTYVKSRDPDELLYNYVVKEMRILFLPILRLFFLVFPPIV